MQLFVKGIVSSLNYQYSFSYLFIEQLLLRFTCLIEHNINDHHLKPFFPNLSQSYIPRITVFFFNVEKRQAKSVFMFKNLRMSVFVSSNA